MTADRPRLLGEEIANSVSHGLGQLLYGTSVMHHTMPLSKSSVFSKCRTMAPTDSHWLYAPFVCHFILMFGYEA